MSLFDANPDFSESPDSTDRLLDLPVPVGRLPRNVRDAMERQRLMGDPLNAVISGLVGAAKRRRRNRRRGQAFWRQFRGMSTAERRAKLAELAKKAREARDARKKKWLAALAARKVKRTQLWEARKAALLAARKKKLAAAIKKSPALRKRIVRHLMVQKLTGVRDGMIAPRSVAQVPQGDVPSPPPENAPACAPVQECYHPTSAEQVEAVEEEKAEDQVEAVEEAEAEGAQEAEQEVSCEEETSEEQETSESLTEPTEEEAEEEAAEEVKEDTTEGVLGMLGAAMRRKARAKRTLAAAVPTAHAIERKSGGKIKARTTIQGCALITAAKAGDRKAKVAIKGLEAKAAKGNPAAKKALAQLKLCNRVVKKARKSAAKRVVMPRAKKGPRGGVYKSQIPIISRGLASYSAHQRGLAMIPAFARTQYRAVRGAAR